MRTGCSQAPTGHGATTVSAAALQAMPAAGHQDDLIRLSRPAATDGIPVVALRGDLDLATADRTVRYVTEVIDAGAQKVRVDLSGLAFCDACGLGALIRIAAHAENSGCQLELVKPSRAATRIMRITGVDDRLLTGSLASMSPGAPNPAVGRG
ncbi:MAG TPA: STAS domain-containing protein [Streptosporangiaceae bacterium]|nr:STAS domain-containing protein [Streptosporangiaceae bacterium]